MTESDRDQLYELVSGVYAFYRQDCSPFALGVWWEACRPYDMSAVHDAMNRHAVNPDNGQFLPKPADIVKLIGGGSADGALMAWAKLETAVKRVGPYESVVFDDPMMHRVIEDMGGWPDFGSKKDDEWPFVRNHFSTLYRGYRARVGIEFPRYLPGITEMTNSSQGFVKPSPVFIGDEEKARQVFLTGTKALQVAI